MNTRLCVAAFLLLPAAAFAQGNPGPFGGFFGRTPERAGGDYTVLDLRTSGGAQYDDPVFDASDPPEQRERSGSLIGSSAQLRFDRSSDRLRLQLRSSGNFHYFLQEPSVGGTTFDNRATVSARPTTRLGIDLSAAHTYQPFFNYEQAPMAFQPGVVPPTARYIARAVESHTLEGSAGFTSFYAKDASFYASVSRRQTRFMQNRDLDFRMNGVRGGWRRQLTRGLGLRFEYGRDHIHLRAGEERDRLYETVEAGIDFTRPLSLARRTTLNIQTQTAMMRQPPLGRFYRLNGGATLMHLFRRTWDVSLRGQRTTDFAPGFVEPLLADTVGVKLGGLLSRRTELLLQADGGRGQFGFAVDSDPFTTGTAMAQVTFALTRQFGLFAQHALTYYEFPEGASPLAPTARFARQTISVGITTWIPIYTRERSPSDSR